MAFLLQIYVCRLPLQHVHPSPSVRKTNVQLNSRRDRMGDRRIANDFALRRRGNRWLGFWQSDGRTGATTASGTASEPPSRVLRAPWEAGPDSRKRRTWEGRTSPLTLAAASSHFLSSSASSLGFCYLVVTVYLYLPRHLFFIVPLIPLSRRLPARSSHYNLKKQETTLTDLAT